MQLEPGVVMWRIRRGLHYISCVAEQVEEECFELRVFSGYELIHSESLEEIPPLLARVEELRDEYARPEPDTKPDKEPGKASSRKLAPS